MNAFLWCQFVFSWLFSHTYFFWSCEKPGRQTSWSASTLLLHQTAGRELSPEAAGESTYMMVTHSQETLSNSHETFGDLRSYYTWSEREIVGSSLFHIPTMPDIPPMMIITPKKRNICEGNKFYFIFMQTYDRSLKDLSSAYTSQKSAESHPYHNRAVYCTTYYYQPVSFPTLCSNCNTFIFQAWWHNCLQCFRSLLYKLAK